MMNANDQDGLMLVEACELEAITGGSCWAAILYALLSPVTDASAAADAAVQCTM